MNVSSHTITARNKASLSDGLYHPQATLLTSIKGVAFFLSLAAGGRYEVSRIR